MCTNLYTQIMYVWFYCLGNIALSAFIQLVQLKYGMLEPEISHQCLHQNPFTASLLHVL